MGDAEAFTQASHWMEQSRMGLVPLAWLLMSAMYVLTNLQAAPHPQGRTQPQSIPPQSISDCTTKALGGPGGLISSAGEDVGSVMCAHPCEWAWGCNCMALTHAAALLSSLGACHHMIPLHSTSFIPSSFPTMPGVSLSAFHHHNEVCLLFFASFLGSDFLCDLP